MNLNKNKYRKLSQNRSLILIKYLKIIKPLFYYITFIKTHTYKGKHIDNVCL